MTARGPSGATAWACRSSDSDTFTNMDGRGTPPCVPWKHPEARLLLEPARDPEDAGVAWLHRQIGGVAMRRMGWAAGLILLGLCSCRSVGADIVTPTPVPAATSYIAPLQTVRPTAQASAVPTNQPEDFTPLPEIITVEPAIDTSPVSTAGATETATGQP